MGYLRFLLDEDYVANIRMEQFEQIAGRPLNRKVIERAEENSEVTILEYMLNMYHIEDAFSIGKSLIERDLRFTYPAGVYFLHNSVPAITVSELVGKSFPRTEEYWELHLEIDPNGIPLYSQMNEYRVGDLAVYMGNVYRCLVNHGNVSGEIVRPADALKWANLDVSGMTNEQILAIPAYSNSKNTYIIGDEVSYMGSYYSVTANPNADDAVIGENIEEKDPRNSNLKKHMVQLSLYEMAKRISPNNVSASILADYEDTKEWLVAVGKGKINPMVPRIGTKSPSGEERPTSTWAMATMSNVNVGNSWIT